MRSTQLTRNLANTSDASHTVVPKCLELGSYRKQRLNCQRFDINICKKEKTANIEISESINLQ